MAAVVDVISLKNDLFCLIKKKKLLFDNNCIKNQKILSGNVILYFCLSQSVTFHTVRHFTH